MQTVTRARADERDTDPDTGSDGDKAAKAYTCTRRYRLGGKKQGVASPGSTTSV